MKGNTYNSNHNSLEIDDAHSSVIMVKQSLSPIKQPCLNSLDPDSKRDTFLSSRTYLFHKPVGVICSRVDTKPGEARETIYAFVKRLGFPDDVGLVGRLDMDTSGIILFTDCAEFSRAIKDPIEADDCPETESIEARGSSPLEADHQDNMHLHKEKEYHVALLLGRDKIKQFRETQTIDLQQIEKELRAPLTFHRGGRRSQTKECHVKALRTYQDKDYSYGRADFGWVVEVKIQISEGKHHQIRRLAKRSGFHVLSLTRTKISGYLSIESVPNPGDCRWLSCEEKAHLFDALMS